MIFKNEHICIKYPYAFGIRSNISKILKVVLNWKWYWSPTREVWRFGEMNRWQNYWSKVQREHVRKSLRVRAGISDTRGGVHKRAVAQRESRAIRNTNPTKKVNSIIYLKRTYQWWPPNTLSCYICVICNAHFRPLRIETLCVCVCVCVKDLVYQF